MNSVGDIYLNFRKQLSDIYDSNESEQVTILSFESVLNYRRIDISNNINEVLNADNLGRLDVILAELKSGRPIQYILGEAWFYGMKLFVNESVLIPRRETEELVQWIINDIKRFEILPTIILDICTGSGCIALAIKKEFPSVKVFALDNSEAALKVAKQNALKENLDINLLLMDVFNFSLKLNPDIIVSNPPYVLSGEKDGLHKRVKDFEPSSALFVPDDDSLLFYRHIAQWGKENLVSGGSVYFEINEKYGKEISDLHIQLGYLHPTLKKDLQEKDRMFRATNLSKT